MEVRTEDIAVSTSEEVDSAIDAECPECGESTMYETTCTVDSKDNVRCATCDRCGNTIWESPDASHESQVPQVHGETG